MRRILPCLALLPALFPAAPALAGGPLPVSADAAPVVFVETPKPRFVFTLRGGVAVKPDYFGASSYGVGPDLGFDFGYARAFGRDFGSTDPDFERTGLHLRGSFRYIGERSAADHPELTGLNDIDLSVELGLGLAYTQRSYEIFGDVRYGVVGHESVVGELGADLRLHPGDRLTLTAGPRLFLGSDSYAQTYFGVTAAESAASGLAAFTAEGGALSAGIELGATYKIDENWGVEGALTYDRLLNDAAASPITVQGSEDQLRARIGLTRRISLRF